jgi:hypothetical protein
MVRLGLGAEARQAGAAWSAHCQDRAVDLRAGISDQPGFRGLLRLRALLKRQCGAVVRHDGSLMRASAGRAVGSDADRLIKVVAVDGTRGRVRAGTRVAGATGEVTVATLIARSGGTICDGGVALPDASSGPWPPAGLWHAPLMAGVIAPAIRGAERGPSCFPVRQPWKGHLLR